MGGINTVLDIERKIKQEEKIAIVVSARNATDELDDILIAAKTELQTF
jgi:aspartokinase